MDQMIRFANEEDNINDLLKAAMLHFYLGYLHPYFDGNGRMARLIHLWFLIQRGYEAALFVPFSSYIERSRKAYYNAYSLVEGNYKISGVMDITPFLLYFIENVYDKIGNDKKPAETLEKYKEALKTGEITQKESELWTFVLSFYADQPFTTKQLERDFGNAAYATIRSFVMKFTELGLLSTIKMKNKTLYRIG